MRKAIIIKIFTLSVFAVGIFSCVSTGISFEKTKRIVVSPFGDVKPPYIFRISSIHIINKDGFSSGESFINDFLASNGYKYDFQFLFPESRKKDALYSMDLFIKEKGFTNGLKDLTAISGTLHVYALENNKGQINYENGKLLYQIVYTEETTVSINSYHKLYRVIDDLLGSLSRDLKKKRKGRNKFDEGQF